MKILIIARGVPSKHDPQDGCFEMDQALALSSLGHEVVVMALDTRVRRYWRKIGIEKGQNKNVITYRLFAFPTSIIRHLVSYKIGYKLEGWLMKMLYKYVLYKQGNFDLLHAHFLRTIYSATFIKRQYPKVKLIGTEHWSKLASPILSDEVKYLANNSYHKLDELIAVSKSLADTIEHNFGRSPLVVYNLSNLLKPSMPSDKIDNQFKIVAIGSLVQRKGFDFLIKSFSESHLYEKGCKLIIVGDGKERNSLEDLTEKLGLKGHVIFKGQLSKDAVSLQLRASDLYVMSSRSETFSVTLIEAMSLGIPSVATAVGIAAELPLKGVSVIPIDDVPEMVNALKESYKKRKEVDHDSIIEEYKTHFSPVVIAHQLENLYKNYI